MAGRRPLQSGDIMGELQLLVACLQLVACSNQGWNAFTGPAEAWAMSLAFVILLRLMQCSLLADLLSVLDAGALECQYSDTGAVSGGKSAGYMGKAHSQARGNEI